MSTESGIPPQVKRGKAITVRTHARTAFIDASKHMVADDAEPNADELLDLEETEEEEDITDEETEE